MQAISTISATRDTSQALICTALLWHDTRLRRCNADSCRDVRYALGRLVPRDIPYSRPKECKTEEYGSVGSHSRPSRYCTVGLGPFEGLVPCWSISKAAHPRFCNKGLDFSFCLFRCASPPAALNVTCFPPSRSRLAMQKNVSADSKCSG